MYAFGRNCWKWNRLDEPVLIEGSKPLLIELTIHHRLESERKAKVKTSLMRSYLVLSTSDFFGPFYNN